MFREPAPPPLPRYSHQSFAGRRPPTSNSLTAAGPRAPPPLGYYRPSSVGGGLRPPSAAAATAVPNIRRTANDATGVPAACHPPPAPSLYQANAVPRMRPTAPRNVSAVPDFFYAASTSSHAGDCLSSLMHAPPPAYQDLFSTSATVARGTAVPASGRPAVSLASTIPAVGGRASTEISGDVWALLQSYGNLIMSVKRLSFLAMQHALTTIHRGRTHQYVGTFPHVEEAWTRLCTIGRLLPRVDKQFNDFAAFMRCLCSGEVDVGGVDAATIERSARFVGDCLQRMTAIHDRLLRWKLPNEQNGQIVAACVSGMADDILRLADEFLSVLTTFETTIALTLPSVGSPPDTPVAPAVEMPVTELPTVRSSDHVDDVLCRFSSDAFSQFQLSPGSEAEHQRRIAARLTEDVDRLLSSNQPQQQLLRSDRTASAAVQPHAGDLCDGVPSREPFSDDPVRNGDPDADALSAASVIQPLFVIPLDGTGDDDNATASPSVAAEIKFATAMQADSRQRVRRIDLGTIELDPECDNNGSGLSPPETVAYSPPLSSVEDVFAAPAISVASDNNLWSDCFVQVPFPPREEPTSSIHGNDKAGDDREAVGLQSHTVTPSLDTTSDLYVKPLVNSPLCDVAQCQSQFMATFPSLLHDDEHSNTPSGNMDLPAASPVSDVIDLTSEAEEEHEEAKPSLDLLDGPWPPLSVATSSTYPDLSIRFSLPSSASPQSSIAATLSPEKREVEQPSVTGSQPFDDCDDALLCDDRAPNASSEPEVVRVGDKEKGPCCQILNVFSLPPDEDGAVASAPADATEPKPAAAPETATENADYQLPTVAKREFLDCTAAADRHVAEASEVNAGLASSIARDVVQQLSEFVSRELSATSKTHHSDVNDAAPSLGGKEVRGQRWWRPRKMIPVSRRRSKQVSRSHSVDRLPTSEADVEHKHCRPESYSTERPFDVQSLPSCQRTAEMDNLVEPSSQDAHKVPTSKEPSNKRKNVTIEREEDATPVKRKRGRPPRNHSQTKASSSNADSGNSSRNTGSINIAVNTSKDQTGNEKFGCMPGHVNPAERHDSGLVLSCRASADTDKLVEPPYQDVEESKVPVSKESKKKKIVREDEAHPVKRKPGRPPGSSLHSPTKASSSSAHSRNFSRNSESENVAVNTSKGQAGNEKFWYTLEPVNPTVRSSEVESLSSCQATVETRNLVETPCQGVEESKIPVSKEFKKKKIVREDEAHPVKRKPGRPPGSSLHSPTKASSPSARSRNSSRNTESENTAATSTPVQTGNEKSCSLSEPVNLSQLPSSESGHSDDVDRHERYRLGSSLVERSSEEAWRHPVEMFNPVGPGNENVEKTKIRMSIYKESSTGNYTTLAHREAGSSPVKKKRGRLPGSRLHRDTMTSSANVDLGKGSHRTKGGNVAGNTAHGRHKVDSDRIPSIRKFCSALKSINSFDPSLVDHSKKEPARASVRFWQPGTGVVNLAPPSACARSSNATEKVSSPREWKPAVPKKSLEFRHPQEKATSDTSSSDNNRNGNQPMVARPRVADGQPMPKLNINQVHSPPDREEWSDVEPMSPEHRTPVVPTPADVQPSFNQRSRSPDQRVFEDISDDDDDDDDDEPSRLMIDDESVEKCPDDPTFRAETATVRNSPSQDGPNTSSNTKSPGKSIGETSKITTDLNDPGDSCSHGKHEDSRLPRSNIEAGVKPKVDGSSSSGTTLPSDPMNAGSNCLRKQTQHQHHKRKPAAADEKSSSRKMHPVETDKLVDCLPGKGASRLKSSSPKIRPSSTEDSKTRSEETGHWKQHRSKYRPSLPESDSARFLMERWASAAEEDARQVSMNWKSKLKETESRIMTKLRRKDATLDNAEHGVTEEQLEENEQQVRVQHVDRLLRGPPPSRVKVR